MSLLDLIYPPRCAACGDRMAEAAPLCSGCAPALVPVPEPWCGRCGVPVEGEGDCGRCRLHPPPFAEAHAAFAFAGAIREAVTRFKYLDAPHLAGPLAALSWPALAGALARCDAVVPAPLHRDRLRRRGYDQALLLAEAWARLAHKPCWEPLERIRATERQVGAGAAARLENLAGAFAVRGQRGRWVAGARLLLVDDVITTGATLRAAAHALVSAGAARVTVAAVARAF